MELDITIKDTIKDVMIQDAMIQDDMIQETEILAEVITGDLTEDVIHIADSIMLNV